MSTRTETQRPWWLRVEAVCTHCLVTHAMHCDVRCSVCARLVCRDCAVVVVRSRRSYCADCAPRQSR